MKACVFTLGCKLNEVESASLMHGLEELGYEVTEELCPADLYLLNTCAVTAEAERKSRQAVARMRKFDPSAPVFVFGCAASKAPASFAEREGVIYVGGAMHKDRVLQAVQMGLTGTEPLPEETFSELPPPKQTKTRAFLRIQDGCNRFCSYCIIPYLRGRSRSRRAESVLAEAEASGAKEIVLTGVDLTSYRDGETDFGGLLKALGKLPARIRLGSLEEGIVTDNFLQAVSEAGNVVPHFHLSLQSGSDAVLRAMNRRYTREEYLASCRKIYECFPDAAVTTDIIVGYPTETEEDFRETLSLIREAGFAHVHAFPFSMRPGTRAAKLRDLPVSIKKERMARVTQEAKVSEERFLKRFLNSVRKALFEQDGGYTENYIRVYCENANEGGMYEVRLLEPYRDGARCEIVKEL